MKQIGGVRGVPSAQIMHTKQSVYVPSLSPDFGWALKNREKKIEIEMNVNRISHPPLRLYERTFLFLLLENVQSMLPI